MTEMTPEGAAIVEAVNAPPADTAVDEPGFQVDPTEWAQTQERLAELQQIVQPPPQPWQQQPQGPPVPDPFAEDYANQLEAYIEAKTAPMREWQQQQQLSAAEQQAMGTLEQLAASGGAFDRDMAWARANQIILTNGGDPNKALQQAATETREYERRVGEAYYQQQIQHLQGNAAAPRGPLPIGAAGAQTIPTGGLGNVPNAVTAKFFGPQVGRG